MRSWRSEAADLLTAVGVVAATAAAFLGLGLQMQDRPCAAASVEARAGTTASDYGPARRPLSASTSTPARRRP